MSTEAEHPLAGIEIELATIDDIQAIVEMFQSDEFGHSDGWNEENRIVYETAFRRIAESADSRLYVVRQGSVVIGTFELTFMPVIYGLGAHRAILEGVQVLADRRSLGIGRLILKFVEQEARDMGAKSVLLTSNKKRLDAHRFYEKNGYHKGHDGFKKIL